MALPIPNDWDEQSHRFLTVRVPDSPLWRGTVTGKVNELTDIWVWDKRTGDSAIAAEIGWKIFESIKTGGGMEIQWIAHMSEQQSVPGNHTDVLWMLSQTEVNLNNQFNTTSHVWTVPSTGAYLVGAFVQFTSMPTTSSARVRARLNGVDFVLQSGIVEDNRDLDKHAKFEMPTYLQQGDEIDFVVSQSATTNKNTSGRVRTQRAWACRL